MPFYGEPSKSCLECRLKRRRCDLKRPSCSPCLRASAECSGYRTKFDVAFRDQTRQVIYKAKRTGHSRPPPTPPTPPAQAPAARPAPAHRRVPRAALVASRVPDMWPSETFFLDEVARSFFFQRCMYVDGVDTKQAGLNFVEDMYHSAQEGDMLREAVEALGLLLSSSLAERRDGVQRAHTKYGRALRLTSAALNDESSAKSDHAITTVLMLQMYETAKCTSLSSYEVATRHVDGAARLLHLRGPEILETASGKKLFYLIRTQMLLGSYFRNLPVPASLLYMMRQCKKSQWTPAEESSNLLSELSAISCKIRSDIACGAVTSDQALALLLRLDADIRRWHAMARGRFTYEHRPPTPGMDACGPFVTWFPSRMEAMMWMQFHSIRLMAHASLLRVLPPDGEPNALAVDAADLRRASRAAELESRRETCAALPELLQADNLRRGLPAMHRVSLPAALSTCWHVYTAACGATAPARLRAWAVRMLYTMERRTAIQLAGTLARQLVQEECGA